MGLFFIVLVIICYFLFRGETSEQKYKREQIEKLKSEITSLQRSRFQEKNQVKLLARRIIYWIEYHALLKDGIDKLSGIEFERFVGNIFQNKGFKVEYTPTSGDFGADIILTDKHSAIKTAVQVKRWQKNVGLDVISQINKGMLYYKCPKGLIVTNSGFTWDIQKQKKNWSNIEFIDRFQLIKLLIDTNKIPYFDEVKYSQLNVNEYLTFKSNIYNEHSVEEYIKTDKYLQNKLLHIDQFYDSLIDPMQKDLQALQKR